MSLQTNISNLMALWQLKRVARYLHTIDAFEAFELVYSLQKATYEELYG